MLWPTVIPLLLLYDQFLPLFTTLNIDLVRSRPSIKSHLLGFNKECAQTTPILTVFVEEKVLISTRFIFSSLFLTLFGLGECSPSSRKTFIISVTDGAFELKFCDFYFLCIGDISWKKVFSRTGVIFSQVIYF